MANALVWFLYALCLNPEAQDKIHEEVTRVVQDPLGNPTYEELPSLVYLDAAFRESMRLYTTLPVPAPRTVVSPTELGGHIIQPGTKVIVNFAAMHMNPKFWPNPTEYLPERFLDSKETSDAFMPFSDGGHMCPGYRLAYVQAKGYFAPLMRRYRCELVEGQTFEAVEAISTGLRDGMRVRMRRR